jgi:hypothetical protein
MKYILIVRKNSEDARPIEWGARDRLRTFQIGYKQALMDQGWRSYTTYSKDYYNLVDGNGNQISLYLLTEQEWKDED